MKSTTASGISRRRFSGFVAGVAKSMELNKVWRQSSFMAAMIGDYISAHSFGDALDNGNIGSLRAAFCIKPLILAGVKS